MLELPTANQLIHVVVEPHGLTHTHEVSGRDDVATDEEIFGNVAGSKSIDDLVRLD